jgi:orotidine-5'-phosphate decarboxylase
MQGFRERLKARQESANSLVCVGLDPLIEKLPAEYRGLDKGNAIRLWMSDVVNATAKYASMFKPQRAHWEAVRGGAEALSSVVEYIRTHYPDIPIFLDCKRGDIDRTQKQYSYAHFELDGVDGMNYNGYMGKDTLRSLVDPRWPGRALVGLGRTSNPEAWEVQDRLLTDGRLVWEAMVQDILNWSTEFGVLENAGVVMGAAHADNRIGRRGMIYSEHLARARTNVGNKLWFLIPGIGTQGGFIEETVLAAYTGSGSIAINSSSGIIFSEDPAAEARKLRDQINDHIPYQTVGA